MKYIVSVLFLIYSLSGIAQMKLEISPSDSKYAKMSIDCEDQAKCDDKLVKWIKRQKFFKGVFNDISEGSIASKEETTLGGVAKTVYFHADNFSIAIDDMTRDISDKKAKRLAKKNLKDKLNNKKDLTLKEINELLRD